MELRAHEGGTHHRILLSLAAEPSLRPAEDASAATVSSEDASVE
jgi:hypothetical protein